MESSGPVMLGSYAHGLVILSVLISILAASAALTLAGRVAAAFGIARLSWLIGGATASGIGTWSMHFTGMLAFKLPVQVQYDWPTALLSLLPAACGFAVALFVMCRRNNGWLWVMVGGIFVGGGIAAMHYTAMASMRLSGMCHYSPFLVALSVALAILFSGIPLKLMFIFWEAKTGKMLAKAASVVLLGAANPIMHYTGMAATTYTRSQVVPDLSHAVPISLIGIEGIVIVPLMVLAAALVTSLVDKRDKSLGQLRALTAQLQVIREEERSRVAREIHDELGQALTAIKLDMNSLLRAVPADKEVEAQRGKSILKLLDETIQSVRRIATELRPGVLDELGLVAAVEWAAEEFQARTGTKCRLSLPDVEIAIDAERATALFRIFQETLTNVARHAHATEVNVRIAKQDGGLTLEVHDNGKGISQEQYATSRSLGILGMRERALLLGGELNICGAPGKGTTVSVRIPEANLKSPEAAK